MVEEQEPIESQNPASTAEAQASADNTPSDDGRPDTQKKPNPIWEWLWRGARARELRSELERRTTNFHLSLDRAQQTLSLVQKLDEEGAEGESKPRAVQAHLYLEALGLAGEALQEVPEFAAENLLVPASEPGRSDGAPAFLGWSQEELVRARETYDALRGTSLRSLFELAPSEGQVRGLAHLANAAVAVANRPRRELEDLWIGRLLRVVVPLVVLIVGCASLIISEQRAKMSEETTMPWKASSAFAHEQGCKSPLQECAESRFFFCTEEEEEPWIEFDLEKVKSVSQVLVVNRSDCCSERAVPLVIEVSSDRRAWKEVARKNETFSEWDADFPAAKARWVRVRALRKTFLHLKQVRIKK